LRSISSTEGRERPDLSGREKKKKGRIPFFFLFNPPGGGVEERKKGESYCFPRAAEGSQGFLDEEKEPGFLNVQVGGGRNGRTSRSGRRGTAGYPSFEKGGVNSSEKKGKGAF